MSNPKEWEIDTSSSRFRERLAAEKRIRVYFIPGKDRDGRVTYIYAVASEVVHTQFMESLQLGAIPDFAVIVQFGYGEPTSDVKTKIKHYYGFDHDSAAA